MPLQCSRCGSTDLWRPRREKALDLIFDVFGFKRFDCRKCRKRSVLRALSRRHPDALPSKGVRFTPGMLAPEVIPVTVEIAVVSVLDEPTVIGTSVQIDGEFRSRENIRVQGRLGGILRAHGCDVTIESEGIVAAAVTAANVVVRGQLQGDTAASGTLTVCREGRLTGKVKAARFLVEDGAHVNTRNQAGATVGVREPVRVP